MLNVMPFLELGENIYSTSVKKINELLVNFNILNDNIKVRPYKDEEINSKANQFLNNKLNALIFSTLINTTTKGINIKKLFSDLRKANSLDSFQKTYVEIVEGIHSRTVSSFKIRGLENLDKNRSYQFISNHNNIIMNPYDISLALISKGFKGPYTVAGDNLANITFADMLFKLLGTAIIIRTGPSMDNTREFSKFVYDAKEEGRSLWIAQAPGRAKDNYNVTNPAVIRMITSGGRAMKKSMNEIVNDYFVPVTISSEYEPCDGCMAKELAKTETEGNYEKGSIEDMKSMFYGVRGHKGNMVVTFGKPLQGDFNNYIKKGSKQIAKAIDEQIINNYHIFETNEYAYKKLTTNIDKMKDEPNPLEDRVKGLSVYEASKLYRYYANPVAQQREAA